MSKLKLALTAALAIPAIAQASTRTAPEYQDAQLIGFSDAASGSHCVSSGNATAVSSTVYANGQTHCYDSSRRYYKIKIGEMVYTVTPIATGKEKAIVLGTLGYGAFFMKNSVLYRKMPGTHVEIRNDDSGFHVRLGKRESLYEVVAAGE